MKITIIILICVFASLREAVALDRFAALSMVESGNCDACIGPNGERSRYQITPAVVTEFGLDASRLADFAYAFPVAGNIMAIRCIQFETIRHRTPTDFEFYLLWHRPALVMSHNPRRITRAEADRAQRFANLCAIPVPHSALRTPHFKTGGSR